MSQFTLVWDVLMTGEAIMTKKADVRLAEEMEAHAPSLTFQTVQRWNYVAEGKKVSAQGFTNGLRLTSSLAQLQGVEHHIQHLNGFTSSLAQTSTCRVAESIPFPLERDVKQRLPSIGRLGLKTSFTHGMGLTDHKKINNAKSDQTRMTKDGLDPTRVGKNSSAAWFSDAFRALMSSTNWFLVLPTYGEQPSSILGSRAGADGGVYEFSFDLQRAIDELGDLSEGFWWTPLNEHEAMSMHPTLIFDPTPILESPYDPAKFLHLDDPEKTKVRIENVLKFEDEQTGDELVKDDLSYILERMVRGRRLVKQATTGDGLVSGMEAFVVKSKFIQPLVTEEFFNAMAFFVMTRHPKFWRNGASEVLLFHDLESLRTIEH